VCVCACARAYVCVCQYVYVCGVFWCELSLLLPVGLSCVSVYVDVGVGAGVCEYVDVGVYGLVCVYHSCVYQRWCGGALLAD